MGQNVILCNVINREGEMTQILESYTVEEVATSLKLHPYTVRRLCREGKIPCFKFGGQWRFRKDEIEEWSKSKQERQRNG